MIKRARALSEISCVFGPTAAGKTAFAIKLASKTNGCIINADSMQIYAELRDLTARPSVEEESHAPHRLYGLLKHNEHCNAVSWSALATQEIERCISMGLHPILVGGTGLYFRALLDGMSPIPQVEQKIDRAVRKMSDLRLNQILSITGETHLLDPQRKQRAAAVYLSSGRKLTDWQSISPTPCPYIYDFHILWPKRETVYSKIDQRFDDMINRGSAIKEVQNLLSLNPEPDSQLMRAIGVPEISAFLEGEITKEEAIAAAQQATRRYAKRQFTWMRSTKAQFEADPKLKDKLIIHEI